VWIWAGISAFCTATRAQPTAVSLREAQETALENHPRVAAAVLEAAASGFATRQVRAAYYPLLSGNLTAVGSEHGAVLSAGAVTTSSIYSRTASGIVASQLLTDFGRTPSLERSAKLHNASRSQEVTNTRAGILVEVQEAYYAALASQSVLKVAQATLDLRQLTLRQVSALARSGLRSTIDVSFAEVNASQAQLDLFHAENDAKASHARLSAAMGYDRDRPFALMDEALPPPLELDAEQLIAQALRDRPDLAALRLEHDSLESRAEAEKRLRNPVLTATAVAGVAPERDPRLPEKYGAVGINVNIPVLNGGLFKARQEEAEANAAAADKDVENLSLEIARDVQVAWLAANDAFRRLDVTARMVTEANEALRLAQARYDAALGSIVELNQAQLNQTAAQIAAASAKYEYLSRRADLNYVTGVLR
jgi:outer membrane protein